MRRWLVPVICLAACDTGFELPSEVTDLRILALRSDPAEVVVDIDFMNPAGVTIPPVTITALVADPGASRRLRYRLSVCLRTNTLRCDEPTDPVMPFAEGVLEDPEGALPAEPTGTFTATPAMIRAALDDDDGFGVGGLLLQIELRLWPDGAPEDGPDTIFAAKRVLYGPRIPDGRVANLNPTLAELRAGGMTMATARCGDPAAAPLEIRAGSELELLPVEPAGVRETYVVPTLDGGSRWFTENMRYAWFATAGEISDGETGGPVDGFGNVPLLRTRYLAPEDEGPVRLWLVQRDERGGTSWTERCFLVKR